MFVLDKVDAIDRDTIAAGDLLVLLADTLVGRDGHARTDLGVAQVVDLVLGLRGRPAPGPRISPRHSENP